MVAYCLSLQPDGIIKIIHDLAIADQRRTLDASLELVASIK